MQLEAEKEKHGIILFDGVCNLCNFWVDGLIQLDQGRHFRYASLQSRFAREYKKQKNIPDETRDTVILLINQSVYIKSEAILRILIRIHRTGVVFYPLLWIPAPWRDWIYDWIARNRFRWFGKKNECRLPLPYEKEFFLD